MWLEAILTREDLRDVAERFSPLEIVLGVTGSLLLVSPRDVSLVPDKGLALTCDATIHWPVLGIDVPVSLRGLLVNVLPAVEARGSATALVFRLQIDHTGVAILPSFFDHTVTARINEELERKHVELAWNFTETLTHAFALPPSLASSEAIALRAIAGRVKTTDSALGLAVEFEASVQPRRARSGASNGVDRERPADPAQSAPVNGTSASLPALPAWNGVDGRSLAMGALAGGLLMTALRAVGGIGKRRTRWST
jgi:hypothetical protein